MATNLTRIYPISFFYRYETFERDARLDYKFIINESNWILDPRNPNTVSPEVIIHSEFDSTNSLIQYLASEDVHRIIGEQPVANLFFSDFLPSLPDPLIDTWPGLSYF